jgi:hypothetical protein
MIRGFETISSGTFHGYFFKAAVVGGEAVLDLRFNDRFLEKQPLCAGLAGLLGEANDTL